MTTAAAVPGSVVVVVAETLPNGVKVASVRVDGYAAVKRLPQVIDLDGTTYGRTGWNSDAMVAYYRTDAVVARGVR